MLLIAGSIRIDPTQRDELIETAIEVVDELRRQVGCSYMAVSADLEDRGLLHLIQMWDSQAALSANLERPRIDAIRDHIGKLGILEMAILKYDVAAVRPL